MSVVHRRRLATTLVAAAGIAAAVIPTSANATPVTNACKNSVTANNSQITVDTSATAPATVAPGAAIALTNIQQNGTVPGSIFAAGYNLGLLTTGSNTIPAKVLTKIEGTNTVEGVKNTSTADITISTVISDPDGNPGTGDETATDGSYSVTYADMAFTAGASGTVSFRQDTQTPIQASASPSFATLGKGTLLIRAVVGGVFPVGFGCTPGTVTPPDPGTVAFIDPAPSFASTLIVAPPTGLVTGAGTNGNTTAPNAFTINAPDSSSGTLTFTGSTRTYNGTISCVNVVGNAATIVSQDTAAGYLNRAMVQDNGATGDKIINTMVKLSTASQKTINAYKVCIAPDTTKLAAANAITGDITINPSPSARAKAKAKAKAKKARARARARRAL